MINSFLNALLFATCRAWLGAGNDAKPKLPRWAFYVITIGFAYWNTLNLLETALWWYIIVVGMGLRTAQLFTCDKDAIKYGTIKGLLCVPAIIYLGAWPCLALISQGFLYWYCVRKWHSEGVRVAEIFTGAMVGIGLN